MPMERLFWACRWATVIAGPEVRQLMVDASLKAASCRSINTLTLSSHRGPVEDLLLLGGVSHPLGLGPELGTFGIFKFLQ